jgi:hypothetical protein
VGRLIGLRRHLGRARLNRAGSVLRPRRQGIAVVHNTGSYRCLRPIDNFGYGPSRCVLKKEIYTTLREFYVSREGLATAQNTVRRSAANWVG